MFVFVYTHTPGFGDFSFTEHGTGRLTITLDVYTPTRLALETSASLNMVPVDLLLLCSRHTYMCLGMRVSGYADIT